MMRGDDELFGSDEQRALLRRGCAMAELLRQDPRFSYYGRTVGMVGHGWAWLGLRTRVLNNSPL
jgi:hypothetical protein